MKDLDLEALVIRHADVTQDAAEEASRANREAAKQEKIEREFAKHSKIKYIPNTGLKRKTQDKLWWIVHHLDETPYHIKASLIKTAKRYGAVSHHNADILFDTLTTHTAYTDENTSLNGVYTFLPYAGGDFDKQIDGELTVHENVDKQVLKRLYKTTLPRQELFEILVAAVSLEKLKMKLTYLTICPCCGHDCSADVNKATRWEDYKASSSDAYFKDPVENLVEDHVEDMDEDSDEFEDEFIDTVYSYVNTTKLPREISSAAYNRLDDLTASYYCPICLTKIVK